MYRGTSTDSSQSRHLEQCSGRRIWKLWKLLCISVTSVVDPQELPRDVEYEAMLAAAMGWIQDIFP